jgi:hypothetical protein
MMKMMTITMMIGTAVNRQHPDVSLALPEDR